MSSYLFLANVVINKIDWENKLYWNKSWIPSYLESTLLKLLNLNERKVLRYHNEQIYYHGHFLHKFLKGIRDSWY